VAQYDSPGYQDRLPGLPPMDANGWGSASGSTPDVGPHAQPPIPPHDPLTRPLIVGPLASTYSSDAVPVSNYDSLEAPQAALYLGTDPGGKIFGGIPPGEFGPDGPTQPGKGKVVTPHHPNSLGIGGTAGRP
jgi:hypothetical protein